MSPMTNSTKSCKKPPRGLGGDGPSSKSSQYDTLKPQIVAPSSGSLPISLSRIPHKQTLQKHKNSKYWLNKNDELWRNIIYVLFPGCAALHIPYTDPCRGRVEAHHIISRSVRSLRHQTENGLGRCHWHHIRSTECSPHAGPIGYVYLLQNEYPDQYEWWRKHRCHVGDRNYRETCYQLVDIWKALEEGLTPEWSNNGIIFT